MLPALEPCSRLFALLSLRLDRLCQPNPKYTPNQAEQDVARSRNKMVFAVHVICFCIYLSDYFLRNAPLMDCLFRGFLCIAVIIFLFLSCRFHPQIFRVVYALVCISYGPGVIESSEEGIHAAWAMAPMLPMFQFLFTGSYWHSALQAVIQLTFLNASYYDKMKQTVIEMSPEDYTFALKQSFTLVFVIHAIIIYLMQHFMNQAYQRASISESKKAHVEKQKTFLLSFSHELRNLINSLSGNVKLANLEKDLSNRTKELLLNAEVCGELLTHLVNNILDTGKVEVGELEINQTPIKIYDTLEKIWCVCSELIRVKQLRGRMRIAKNIPRTILTDSHRLTQIVFNLVCNSIKFTERGSIAVGVEWKSGCSEVTEECFQPYPFNDIDDQDEGLFEKSQDFNIFNNDYLNLNLSGKKINTSSLRSPDSSERGVLKVTITDTGCGMTNLDIKNPFQRSSDVSDESSRRKLGTGLGLFITKQICSKLGGEIRIFSKQDVGSCVIFCLPINTVRHLSHQHTDMESLKTLIRAKHLKAMVVDDAPFNCLIIRNFLEKIGVTVMDVAVNGLEAFEKYSALCQRNERPEIITMDIDMPIMDGKDASKMIRELENREGLVPCFLSIVSANCADSEVNDCLDKEGQVKADCFIKKPASMEDLLNAIGNHFIYE